MRERKSCLGVVTRMCLLALLPCAVLAACGGTTNNNPQNPAGAGPAPVDLDRKSVV